MRLKCGLNRITEVTLAARPALIPAVFPKVNEARTQRAYRTKTAVAYEMNGVSAINAFGVVMNQSEV